MFIQKACNTDGVGITMESYLYSTLAI